MSMPPPGWYDDPATPGRVRYWNGAGWTDHVADREQVVAGQGAGASPAPQVGAPAPNDQDRHPDGANEGAGAGTEPPSRADGHEGGGLFGGPGPARGADPARSRARRPRTSDGTPLAPWWRRLVARIIDEFVCGLLGLPLILPVVLARGEGLANYLDAAQSASLAGRPIPVASEEVVATISIVGLLGVLVYFTYEMVGLVRFGTTLGRKAVRIRVRRVDRGPLNLEAVSRRSAVKVAGPVVSGAPAIGDAGLFIVLIDIGRGLLDRGRRTVHDLVGGTEVVLDDGSSPGAGPRR